MANNAQSTLFDLFSTLSQQFSGSSGGGLFGPVLDAAGGSSGSNGSGSKQGGAAGAAASVARSALNATPVGWVWSLVDWFGGGEPAAPPPLVKYALPPSQSFEAAETDTGLAAVDYGQGGTPRPYGERAPSSAPQVQVTVHAMDARSFLDRS